MSRGLPSLLNQAFQGDNIIVIALLKLEYDSGTQRYHTGVGDIVFDSGTGNETYLGVGTFGSVEAITEEIGAKMSGIRVGLEGVNTALVNLAVAEQIQGRSATLFLGVYDREQGALLDAFEAFSGYMDVSEIVRGEKGSIILSIESIFAKFDLPNIRRLTNEDHQQRYPGDLFFDQLSQITESEIYWGPKSSSGSGSVSGVIAYRDLIPLRGP